MSDQYTAQTAAVECVRLHDPASGLDGNIALVGTDLCRRLHTAGARLLIADARALQPA